MNDEFGSDYYTISDEDGNDYVLEHLDTIEMDGVYYLAFVPADMDPSDSRYGMLIMKNEKGADGDDYLVVPPDEELEKVYGKFMERLFGDEEAENDEEDN